MPDPASTQEGSITIRTTLLVIVAVALTACVSDEEQAALDQAEDKQKCASFGFQPGTGRFDRLLRHSHVVTMRGDCYRLREKRRAGLLKPLNLKPEKVT